MRVFPALLLVCAFVSVAAAAVVALAADKPNIVVILADDLGYGDVSCYNPDSKIATPRIDALAAQGARFVDAHTPCSVCSPTRYGLLTGRYCWRTRLKSGVLNGYSRALIEPGRATLATLTAAAGYRTGCFGKWHLGLGAAEPADYARSLSPGPMAAGFQESFILPASLDMPPYVFVENEKPTAFPSETIAASAMRRYGGNGYWREGAIAPGFRHVDTLPAIAQKSTEFISRQEAGKPFFLYVPLTAPHTPWMPTDEYRGRSNVGFYGDFVMQVDAVVGQLLDTLEKNKLAEQTLVIFTSDNGAHWLASDIEQWKHRANANWRGMKADIWEGGHRVPFIVRWPKVVTAGSQRKELVSLTDVFATVAEILGLRLAAGEAEDSFSFLPAITGEPATHPPRESMIHQAADGMLGIRQGAWKLATKLGSHGFSEPKQLEPDPDGAQGQLYNLAKDPAETRNLWLEEPLVVKKLLALLEAGQSAERTRPE